MASLPTSDIPPRMESSPKSKAKSIGIVLNEGHFFSNEDLIRASRYAGENYADDNSTYLCKLGIFPFLHALYLSLCISNICLIRSATFFITSLSGPILLNPLLLLIGETLQSRREKNIGKDFRSSMIINLSLEFRFPLIFVYILL